MLRLDEAIQRLKNEILSQDWRLSVSRIERLEEAFGCLRNRFSTRKALASLLTMATNTLEYRKKRGDEGHPEAMDFLKEAMAHIVGLYEDPHFDPGHDDQIFQSVYLRFSKLKEKIKGKSAAPPAAAGVLTLDPTGGGGEDSGRGPEAAPPAGEYAQLAADIVAPEQNKTAPLNAEEAARLIDELQKSLTRAEQLSATIRALLANLPRGSAWSNDQAGGSLTLLASWDQTKPAGPVPVAPPAPTAAMAVEQSALAAPAATSERIAPAPILTCPPSEVIACLTGGHTIFIPRQYISGIRELPSSSRAGYLKTSSVPLRDFSRFMRSLAAQFQGPLGQMPDRKLKSLQLPIMTPRGGDLTGLPDDDAAWIVFLSSTPWHGVIIATALQEGVKRMVQFHRHPDGDLAGTGYLEGGESLPVLNIASLLQREGFLVMS